jgi:hypothetical protein
MKLILSVLCSIVATAALAHPSLIPHHHPHGATAIPGMATILLIMLTAGGLVALRRLMRKSD